MTRKQTMLNVKISMATLCSSLRSKAKARLDKFRWENMDQTLLSIYWQTSSLLWPGALLWIFLCGPKSGAHPCEVLNVGESHVGRESVQHLPGLALTLVPVLCVMKLVFLELIVILFSLFLKTRLCFVDSKSWLEKFILSVQIKYSKPYGLFSS